MGDQRRNRQKGGSMNDKLILDMLNRNESLQTIVDAVNPGKSWQSMQQYIKRYFVCKTTWKERKANLRKKKSRDIINP